MHTIWCLLADIYVYIHVYELYSSSAHVFVMLNVGVTCYQLSSFGNHLSQ